MIKVELKSGTYSNKLTEFSENGKSFIHKETSSNSQDLIREINYLLNLPTDIKEYFPEVVKSNVSKLPVYYDMPLYGYTSLRSNLINNILDAEQTLQIIEKIAEFTFHKLYMINKSNVDTGFLDRLHFNRIHGRLTTIYKKSNIFNRIVKPNAISVNGEVIPNILVNLNKLSEDIRFRKFMNPKHTCMIHGDFHFDNIIVNPESDKFILLDPRGELSSYDWTYDYGKLWSSFNGMYDLIHEKLFDLETDLEKEIPEFIFNFKEHGSVSNYDEIKVKISGRIDPFIHEYGDFRDWLLRVKFVEAFHFCALAPFHLENDGKEKRALAKYITGAKLLHTSLREYLDT